MAARAMLAHARDRATLLRSREEISVTIGRVWRDAMQGERRSHGKAMATTSNAAVRLPDAIQMLQLFMSDSLGFCMQQSGLNHFQ
ncbi:hypothetical protein SAMN05421881_103315 [Nitrosomonas halophila]|uniref:Uncharacterized protein n=1 Tax=Nitrosomonas halophila TaxID=44576 RepID=A0A1H3JHX3_9PROT|nr:hypothetical protein SAMN05421881_103315 [Nitrosomonas halophila]